jgi:hypothetical protein
MLNVEKRNSTSLEAELTLVGRVLLHVNLSKVAHQDEGLFMSMVNEVFPGVNLFQTFDDVDVEQAIFRAVDSLKLVNYRLWTKKIMQVSRPKIQLYANCAIAHHAIDYSSTPPTAIIDWPVNGHSKFVVSR